MRTVASPLALIARRRTHGSSRFWRDEKGSVFIVALMVLVMLTVIGLSLALVTETEMLIGGNEQVITETFFAAETGLAVAVAQLMTTNSMENKCMAHVAVNSEDSERLLGVRKLGYSIDYTDLYPVAFSAAPYTRANTGREDQLSAGFFRGQARAMRGSWPQEDDVPREDDELLSDIDFTIQAEKIVDIAFYTSPLKALEAGTLNLTFESPETFGCDPDPDHSEIAAGP